MVELSYCIMMCHMYFSGNVLTDDGAFVDIHEDVFAKRLWQRGVGSFIHSTSLFQHIGLNSSILSPSTPAPGSKPRGMLMSTSYERALDLK